MKKITQEQFEKNMTIQGRLKNFAKDFAINVIGGFFIGVGLYCFASLAQFPLTGVSGISLILYNLFGLPIGLMTVIMNIPIAIICYKSLGKLFFLRSASSLVVISIIQDYLVPLIPQYDGNLILAAVSSSVCTGIGYGLIFMNGSSTGGSDFITLTLRTKYPHISIGVFAFSVNFMVIALGGFVYKNFEGCIYGLIICYIESTVIDKLVYGTDRGKMLLIISNKHSAIVNFINVNMNRGCTYLDGEGCYTGNRKHILMCACSNKEAYAIRRFVKDIDPSAFTVIMDSNAVVGEGFKDE